MISVDAACAWDTDIFTPEKRSQIMSAVKSKDSKSERAVRSALHRMGYRFRLHTRSLPGIPDIVLPKYHTAVFVNGCFWHQHYGCKKATIPKKNSSFWATKLARNVDRDAQAKKHLAELGWNVEVVWECEMKPRMFEERMIELARAISQYDLEMERNAI